MRGLCTRRIRHVPQRPLHRAWHQEARRLRQPALDRGNRLRGGAQPPPRGRRHVAGADDRGGEGMGTGPPGWRAVLLPAAPRTDHRRRTDRPAGRPAQHPAGTGDAHPRPRHRRAEAGHRQGARRDLPPRRHRPRRTAHPARCRHRGDRRRPGRLRSHGVHRDLRHRLPDRRFARGPQPEGRRGRRQP